jgi:hypothetical protein
MIFFSNETHHSILQTLAIGISGAKRGKNRRARSNDA